MEKWGRGRGGRAGSAVERLAGGRVVLMIRVMVDCGRAGALRAGCPCCSSCLDIRCFCCCCVRAGEKGGKAAAKGGKGDVAPALPLEAALRKLRQEHAEGMCSISQVGGRGHGAEGQGPYGS